MRQILNPSKKPLIVNGEANKHLLCREFLTRLELEAQLRLQRIETIQEVCCAYMEPSGVIKTFRKDGQQPDPTPRPPSGYDEEIPRGPTR